LDGPRTGLAAIGLWTPEAILARRMASQRTAFAIPEPGPLQGDDHPILEYAAPRTFYLHHHTRGVFRLQRFDERTWQMDLASDDVNSELATLDPPALKTIFGLGYGSANDDLEHYLSDHFAQYSGRRTAPPMAINNRAMLCSLQGTNKNFGIYTPPSAATNLFARQLTMAEYALRGDPTNYPAAIESIQNILDSLPGYRAEDSDWSPDYYADLAIKASLHASNPARAKAILRRGLQLEPDSDQLRYLSRIFLREYPGH
jgi:hypothetical protein